MKLGHVFPSISHLLFADNILIFYRANLEEVRHVQRCIQLYCKWTGQPFNRKKSGCFFSWNVLAKSKVSVKKCLGMRELNKKTKRLGLPLFVGKNKMGTFKELRRKVEAKFSGWKAKFLSQSRSVTLIKHVAHSIPVYSTSSFLLPKWWCDKLEKSARNFLWKNNT